MKIELAPQDKVIELEAWVDKVLDALGHPEALVTDRSSISDFSCEETPVALANRLQLELGIPVESRDYIVDVAKRLKEK